MGTRPSAEATAWRMAKDSKVPSPCLDRPQQNLKKISALADRQRSTPHSGSGEARAGACEHLLEIGFEPRVFDVVLAEEL